MGAWRTWQWILIFGIIGFLPLEAGAQPKSGALILAPASAPAGRSLEEVLDPAGPLWKDARAYPVRLNRTPPLYADGPFDDGERPATTVRLLRLADQTVVIRIEWTDATVNEFTPGKKYPDVGAEHIYPRHTENTSTFGDAVAVMVPQARGPAVSYPSLMMGETGKPVDIYAWMAGRGFAWMNAHGRASTAFAPGFTPGGVPGQASRAPAGWAVTVSVPGLVEGTPLCFAVWDGAKQHRDGVKYFSLWCEVGK
ncbi:MAG: hypothetical protein ACE15F_11595 [bacterium]